MLSDKLLEAYYQAHKNDGFVLLGINAADPASQVQPFVAEYGLTFSILLDPTMKALDAFHTDSLPSSFVVDRTGA
ncbi:MAG: TlpA disulfide reductase family protein, partial [Gallionellaceae bacterium]